MKIMPDPFEEDDEEIGQPQESNKWLKYLLIALVIFISIPIVLLIVVELMLSWGDGKEEKLKSSFTTELGDDFEVYFVEETMFLRVDDFYELRQKGDDQYIIQTTSPVTKDDLTVIEDSDSLRAYRVCGTIIYSQYGKDFRELRHLTDADGRFVGYVRKNLLSSYGFMSNYFHDYVALYPEERELIINAIEKKIKGVLERYGYNYDADELEKMRKELWRYKPIDDSYAAK
jgi:hypothetical protein